MRRLVLFSFYLIFQLIFCKNIFSQNVDHDSTYNLDSGLVEKWLKDQREIKRHPTLHDNVVVGSGAQILGPVVVGKNARIGANAVITKNVPENAVMVGIPAKNVGTATEEFKPYAVTNGNEEKE